jgi:hypothetical protein
MVLKKPTITLLIFFALFQSCNETTKKNQKSTENKNLGTEHFLENDGIQIQLPSDYKRYSSAKYEALLKDFIKGKALELEQKRLRHLRKIDGHHYIYFDNQTKSTVLINTIQHEPMEKEDAKSILSDIVRDQAEASGITKQDFTKVSANYIEGTTAKIFKSLFKVIDKENNKVDHFQHKYYISSKDRYIIIDINTPIELDFDPYLETIRL